PSAPDRTLSPTLEERAILRALRRLQPRQALFADLFQGSVSLITQTMQLPVDELNRRAERTLPAVRDAFWRGRHGVPERDLPQAPEITNVPSQSVEQPMPPSSIRRPPRPKLALP